MATTGTDLSAYQKEAIPSAQGKRIALIVAEWNADITQGLLKGAVTALIDLGVLKNDIDTLNVPGTFELTYGANQVCLTEKYDAVICIGSVIRGETAHFDFVCQGATQGITLLNIQHDIPVVFCVLTDDNKQQSIDRSGGKHGNKGTEAAVTAIKMVHFKIQLNS